MAVNAGVPHKRTDKKRVALVVPQEVGEASQQHWMLGQPLRDSKKMATPVATQEAGEAFQRRGYWSNPWENKLEDRGTCVCPEGGRCLLQQCMVGCPPRIHLRGERPMWLQRR